MKNTFLFWVLLFLYADCNRAKKEMISNHEYVSASSLTSPNVYLTNEYIKGVSFVAPPEPLDSGMIDNLRKINANWISVMPYAFGSAADASVRYNHAGAWRWWGETPEGVRETILQARRRGVSVMVKPQVWMRGSFTGDMEYKNEAQWIHWEKQYEDYILPFATLADSTGAEMFCIGTEFKKSAIARPTFWRNLITKIRQRYRGKLTYAANWDEYEQVPFWDALDMAGVNAYFSLSSSSTPSTSELKKAWRPYLENIRAFQKKINKSLVFTEFGYMSVDSCAYRTWELERGMEKRKTNELAQANALDALFSVFFNEPYWKGGFIWKWYPSADPHERHREKDYSPQGKKAESVVAGWYHKI